MRTKNSLYNFLISAISSLIIPLLGFLKVRFFVDLYGSEINGLQLVIMQVITYLNLFELSFSLAFRQLLYKPLAENNRNKILSIYNSACKMFRFTGTAFIVVCFVVGLLIPFFVETTISYFEIFLYFLILALPYGISYFMMGPNFVIIADQKEYKISIFIQSIAILRMFLMIVFIKLRFPVVTIFLIEGIQILISNFIARKIALKEYPWLLDEYNGEEDSSFKENVKYTTIHRLSVIASNNTDNIVIGTFAGLKSVSIYGAYTYLSEAITKIINSAITSPINSFGNLFNDSDKEKAYEIFTEHFNLSNYIGTIIGVCVFVAIDRFVLLWMGNVEYVLPTFALFLFSLNLYYLTQRESVLITRDANGLFKESKNNAYLMVFTKIVLSIILVKKFDVVGVLVATSIVYWIVDFFYNPILIYKKVFHMNPMRYYKMIASRIVLALSIGFLSYALFNHFAYFIDVNKIHFIISCLILGIFVFVITSVFYFILYKSFRNLVNRFYRIIFKRG